MPLEKSPAEKAFRSNLRKELGAGKPPKEKKPRSPDNLRAALGKKR